MVYGKWITGGFRKFSDREVSGQGKFSYISVEIDEKLKVIYFACRAKR